MKRNIPKASLKAAKVMVAAGNLELVGRQCKLQPYKRCRIPDEFSSNELVTYVSPDSTYYVTRELIERASKTILIGIYDFTATYVKELLLKAMRRGVKVTLMLDLDGRTGERPLYDELGRFGAETVPAPSCASKVAKFFPSCHEKVIVVDDEWVLVQSGNYSDASIPLNETDGGDPATWEPGNRDMGIAVHDKKLAGFFRKLLRADMKLETDAAVLETAFGRIAQLDEVAVLEAAPPKVPIERFASKLFSGKNVKLTPVVSPDNYMDVIPNFLMSAKTSISIENQYIRGSQPKIRMLLTAIRDAVKARRGLRVRIILAAPRGAKDIQKEQANLALLEKDFGLKIGKHVRILSRDFFVHCHNKLVIVDDNEVLVSSQNWSDFAVDSNREAGLIVHARKIAQYFAGAFEFDWKTGSKKLPRARAAAPEFFSPKALSTGRMVRLNWGDFAEV